MLRLLIIAQNGCFASAQKVQCSPVKQSMLMNGILRYWCIALLNGWVFLLPSAQAQEASMDTMTWTEMTEKLEALSSKGRYADALPYARAALEKARADSTEESLDYGNSLDYLGYTLHHLGQYIEAERSFSAAVEHARLHLGENHEDYITRLSNLAMLHLDMEKVALSVSELEEVCRLAEKNLPEDNPYVGIMINNLGLAYERIGNLELALRYYLRALDLTEHTWGKQSVRYAIRLSNIAAIYRKGGNKEKALEFSLNALPIFEKAVGKKHLFYIVGLNGLLNTYVEMGRFEDAFPIADTMRAMLRENQIQKTHDSYNILQSIAYLYYKAGRYDLCIEISQNTLDEYQSIFPRLYASHAFVSYMLLSSWEKLGRLAEAKKYALMLNQFWLDELREKMVNFSEAEQLLLHANHHLIESAGLLFAYHHPEFDELAGMAFDCLLGIKGSSLSNQSAMLRSLRNQPDAQLAAKFETWKAMQVEISKQYALAPNRRMDHLDSLLSVANALERSLALGSESFRMASQNTRWQEVRAALSPGEAALEFGQINTPDSSLYTAYLIRYGDKSPIQVFLFEAKELGNLSATRRLYAFDHSREGKNLNEALWKPLEPLLKGVSTLYFAPAGVLHQINFGAVPLSASEIMADRFTLHRLVSTRLISVLKKEQDSRLPGTALVFGGIRYDTDSLSLHSGVEKVGMRAKRTTALGNHWTFLPGSLIEAQEAQGLLNRAGAKVIFADGFNASEGFFKKTVSESPSPDVLHLATHGFFLTTPDSSAKTGFAAAEDPMVRAGLVLSGANRVWGGQEPPAGQEDGILTAREISRLDLNGTTIAVLSACGTGQGKIEAGEGVFGLQRAFKMAGTHYVIMTLWTVQDNDAQEFMGFFYQAWLENKKSVPASFQEAQKKMRALHAKPFQPMAWAGFVLLE